MNPDIVPTLPQAINMLADVINTIEDNKLKSKLVSVYQSIVAVNSTLNNVANTSAETFEQVKWW